MDKKLKNIINMKHFHAENKPYMSMSDRATQFAPYKSLVGYEQLIDEETEEVLAKGFEEIEYDL
jgi:hypothetical protein